MKSKKAREAISAILIISVNPVNRVHCFFSRLVNMVNTLLRIAITCVSLFIRVKTLMSLT